MVGTRDRTSNVYCIVYSDFFRSTVYDLHTTDTYTGTAFASLGFGIHIRPVLYASFNKYAEENTHYTAPVRKRM